jgi:hypothetical protein
MKKAIVVSLVLVLLGIIAYLYAGLYSLTERYNSLTVEINRENGRMVDAINSKQDKLAPSVLDALDKGLFK